MTKVGILSMQRICNYGSFLQAYGLKSVLEELGYDVQFVDYHPGKCLISSHEGRGLVRGIAKSIEIMMMHVPINEKLQYISYKKNYASKYFPYLEITDNMNYNPSLDVLIIGSDEVFNCIQDNPNVGFSPELFGVGANANKIISYAASFGNTTYNKLLEYNVADCIKEWLGSFDAISVRDGNSGNIVQKLTGRVPLYHMDPVIAYDFTKCDEIHRNIAERDYMILYGYSGRFSSEECKAIRKFANEQGLKIFCIGGIQECCDNFIDCNPFKVIAYFNNSECVITDTFHGTVLSVITHKPFVSFTRSTGYGNEEKIIDFLNRMNLSDRSINITDTKIQDVMSQPINYFDVDKIIDDERDRTYEYLKMCIG